MPDRFRWLLFKEPREAELIWPGKTSEVTNVVLPFQSIEQIDEPRAEANAQVGDLFQIGAGGRQGGGWSNKLIWGDNKLVLASLKGGPLRREIEAAGGLKLVYIDPPFDVGDDFSIELEVGGEGLVKERGVIEEIAYRDTWGGGISSFASMLLERLYLFKDLMAENSSICVHCDWHSGHRIRLLLDEVFGKDNFQNEIVWWYYNKMQGNVGRFASNHDSIFWYSKGDVKYFVPQKEERDKIKRQQKRVWDSATQSLKQARNDDGELVYYDETHRTLDDVWKIPYLMPADRTENVGYSTQKPIELAGRIVEALCPPGGLVLDAFCGSGTTLLAAEGARANRSVGGQKQISYAAPRKWIGIDLGRFAIHTAKKRMIGLQRDLKSAGQPWRSFEILNLGKYERQWFAGIDPTLPEPQRLAAAARAESAYVSLILEAYKAERVEQSPPFHGHKAGAFVVVGALDSPVTEANIHEAVDAARRMGVGRIDVLGFEFEMGLAPRLVDEARAKGVAVALRYIPKDVFDRRAIDKGQVSFHDLAYVEAKATVVSKKERTITVSLTDFGVSYRQDGLDNLIEGMKPGTRVTVEGGQVVKIVKAKDGTVTRDVLTKEWTDWIDYWAVDFDYTSRTETLLETVTQPDGSVKHVPQWTGRYIFENEWQSFRTRKSRALELTTASHSYATPGRKQIAVKVIDIFGNDTTKIIGVEV